ncbi:MAG: glucosaminidase domain-containing protein [Muribaculaceae bacterium]|nr:glucosaminidase domain-containing protein [Muribaculaceae bacterium]
MKILTRILLLVTAFLGVISCSGLKGTVSPGTSILGPHQVEIETMYQFVASRNPGFDRRIAQAFHDVGRRYGIRGDVALCQAIIETGWFRFDNGTAVRPGQHNYCGMGVRSRGQRGASFATVEEGVTAMMQHLYAYATKRGLPKGERLVDPRFKLVERGVAPTWQALSGRWAANPKYGSDILAMYSKMKKYR